MAGLADRVLPLIRTRAELWRWSTANEHGRQMHDAVAILADAVGAADDDADSYPPGEVYTVATKAVASALTVIMRADDSSGIIGDACRDLLALHPVAAAHAGPPPSRLVEWMMRFQFDNPCDFFTLDVVDYAPALGPQGLTAYRAALHARARAIGPRPVGDDVWAPSSTAHRHDWFTLDHNARRLAVLARDPDAVVTTHLRDGKVARWYHDTAEALVEIGQVDLAIDWARRGMDVPPTHQAAGLGEYWCTLLAATATGNAGLSGDAGRSAHVGQHPGRSERLIAARREVFDRWPTAGTAAHLHDDAGDAWPDHQQHVTARLAEASPREAVLFAHLTLHDLPGAWRLAHTLDLHDDRLWNDLATAYGKVDPAAVLPVLNRLVLTELTHTGAQHYRTAARMLTRMRTLAAAADNDASTSTGSHGTGDSTTGQPGPHAAEIDHLVAELRHANRRRPRLQQEFDRARLPS